METDPKYFKIGMFTMGFLLLTILFFICFSSFDLFKKENLYAIYFHGSVTGLRENEDVRFHGIPIGKVKKITFAKDKTDQVKVVIDIQKPSLIRQDAVARIEAQGLTGYTFVQIYGGNNKSPVLKIKPKQKYPIIPSAPSNIESIITDAPKILANVNNMLTQMQKVFDVKTLTHIQATFANIEKVTANLEPSTREFKNVVKDFQSTLTALTQAAKAMQMLIESNQAAVHKFSQQGLPQLMHLISETQDAVTYFSQMAQEIHASPLNYLQRANDQGYVIP